MHLGAQHRNCVSEIHPQFLSFSGFSDLIPKMADRRRRRRRASQDSEEDDESGSGSESARSGSPSLKSRVREPEPVEAPAVRVVPKNDAESECVSVLLPRASVSHIANQDRIIWFRDHGLTS